MKDLPLGQNTDDDDDDDDDDDLSKIQRRTQPLQTMRLLTQ